MNILPQFVSAYLLLSMVMLLTADDLSFPVEVFVAVLTVCAFTRLVQFTATGAKAGPENQRRRIWNTRLRKTYLDSHRLRPYVNRLLNSTWGDCRRQSLTRTGRKN